LCGNRAKAPRIKAPSPRTKVPGKRTLPDKKPPNIEKEQSLCMNIINDLTPLKYNMISEMKRLLLDGHSQTDRPQIAFYAHLSHNIDHLGNHQPIVFDQVRTNQGNAYHTNTHIHDD
jgi:hypothetical protein